MSVFAVFLVFAGYTALYFGQNLARHSSSAGPVLYQAFKIGPATYPGLAGCG